MLQGSDKYGFVPTGFVIYPWQSSGSLSNSYNRTSYPENEDEHMMQWPTVTGKLK
jgi:hypothetical protein